MTSAGPRNRLITIERATVVNDDYGGETLTWAAYAQAWAQVKYGTGGERRAAAQREEMLAATFRVLWTSALKTVTVEDRIAFDGFAWDIHSIAPLGYNEAIEFSATSDLDPGALSRAPAGATPPAPPEHAGAGGDYGG